MLGFGVWSFNTKTKYDALQTLFDVKQRKSRRRQDEIRQDKRPTSRQQERQDKTYDTMHIKIGQDKRQNMACRCLRIVHYKTQTKKEDKTGQDRA